MCSSLHANYLLFLYVFNKPCIFTADLKKKKTQITNFLKIQPVGAEKFHAVRRKTGMDRQTDGRTDAET